MGRLAKYLLCSEHIETLFTNIRSRYLSNLFSFINSSRNLFFSLRLKSKLFSVTIHLSTKFASQPMCINSISASCSPDMLKEDIIFGLIFKLLVPACLIIYYRNGCLYFSIEFPYACFFEHFPCLLSVSCHFFSLSIVLQRSLFACN